MEWIKDNLVEIFAVIGALYAAARVIVTMTPTPKDNEALQKVGVFLKTLRKAFGLDLTQGVHTKDPQRYGIQGTGGGGAKPHVCLLICLLIFLSGCQRGDIRISTVFEGQETPHQGYNIGPELWVEQGAPVKVTGAVIWIRGLDPNDLLGQ